MTGSKLQMSEKLAVPDRGSLKDTKDMALRAQLHTRASERVPQEIHNQFIFLQKTRLRLALKIPVNPPAAKR